MLIRLLNFKETIRMKRMLLSLFSLASTGFGEEICLYPICIL
ncbi:hypothetical protein HanXRQr2_Chr04g0185421 [Helianthus annuus]|uniref:Uncharacterized protein n=1 Tax=Helianthus annuus TaxID=4232 RepID=A0A9K3JAA0_HELAN|nr:hypothetical protein HanXRQr2_Chr04g0185421 [Helianthus annuus]KAJ0932899.1 hypothetical protein HanPSC8_Chr04g0178971 [Helianthus annuus]